jgi:hypothetical protein
MGLFSDMELSMYRKRFLCSLNKLAKGLINSPVNSDEVFKITEIKAFGGGEKEATDNLVQDALLNEYIKLGTGREIILTAEGLQWCKENCA